MATRSNGRTTTVAQHAPQSPPLSELRVLPAGSDESDDASLLEPFTVPEEVTPKERAALHETLHALQQADATLRAADIALTEARGAFKYIAGRLAEKYGRDAGIDAETGRITRRPQEG